MNEIVKKAEAMGYTIADIIEPVDGFHPNQLANSLLSDVLFENIQRDHPDWLGAINPYNDVIDKMFPWTESV